MLPQLNNQFFNFINQNDFTISVLQSYKLFLLYWANCYKFHLNYLYKKFKTKHHIPQAKISMDKSTTLRDFQTLTKLGEGAFGQVFKVKRKTDSQIYAMKKIKLANMKQKQRDNALNQVRILASYNGEYIIGYKQSFYDEISSTLCIIMEFAQGGDLLKLTQNHTKKKTKISESEIWKALVHITFGLRSLHDKKILHRDLKCANIFITSDGTYKLGDLNVSKVLKKDLAKTQTGTPYYASPQVWKDKPYGNKSDMWSLGCVLYQMAALRPPFTATDLPGLYKKICAGQFQRIPANYSNQLSKIISSLLKQNPSQRPTTVQILQNPSVHKNFDKPIDVKINQKQQDDFLLQTLKVNHRNLKSIKQILPKSNYQGELKNSRSRVNTEADQPRTDLPHEKIRKNTQIQTDRPIQRQKSVSVQKKLPNIPPSPKVQDKQKQKRQQERIVKEQKLIDNYLQMKKKHQQKQRQRQIQLLKEQKQILMKKRQRVLSACGPRNHSQVYSSPNSPPKNKGIPPPYNQNNAHYPQQLPPKPQNNQPQQMYKLPPKPSPLIPSKQNNSYENQPQSYRENRVNSGSRQNLNQRQRVISRQKSKQNLIRAGQNILQNNLYNNNSGVEVKRQNPVVNINVGNGQQRKMRPRCNSAQKIIYPNWWID